uniref:Uncharacterized protein n=1 Tax=viral metagenome TaxID=1070528 RepID=A0A6C0EJ21_9ZZZZ
MFHFLSLLLLNSVSANLIGDHYNLTYNITWNNTYVDQVGIILETHMNDKWVSPTKNGYEYLSIILDAQPTYFVWNIPDSFVRDFWKYGNKINIINLINGDVINSNIITEEQLYIENTPNTTTTTKFYPRGYTPTYTSTYTTTYTTIDPTIETRDNKVCIRERCMPTYLIVLISMTLLLIICILCVSCC